MRSPGVGKIFCPLAPVGIPIRNLTSEVLAGDHESAPAAALHWRSCLSEGQAQASGVLHEGRPTPTLERRRARGWSSPSASLRSRPDQQESVVTAALQCFPRCRQRPTLSRSIQEAAGSGFPSPIGSHPTRWSRTRWSSSRRSRSCCRRLGQSHRPNRHFHRRPHRLLRPEPSQQCSETGLQPRRLRSVPLASSSLPCAAEPLDPARRNKPGRGGAVPSATHEEHLDRSSRACRSPLQACSLVRLVSRGERDDECSTAAVRFDLVPVGCRFRPNGYVSTLSGLHRSLWLSRCQRAGSRMRDLPHAPRR